MSAAAAQNSGRVEFLFWPNFRRVPGEFGVAFMTWKPFFAALEFDRDNIPFFVIMSAPRFLIDIQAGDDDAMNNHVHASRSRGHSSTSTDAIIQHAIIKINPLLNDPVR